MNEEYLQRLSAMIETALPSFLPEVPPRLAGAREEMLYALSGGGKRVRMLLCLLFCAACGGEEKTALPFAAAAELVHTYSLIHDDLPCMDDDDYRRGRLSSHKKYGEANAVLAGDALLTHAFFVISSAALNGTVTAEQAVRAAAALSRLAGAAGMVGGQYIDLESEGKAADAETLFAQDALKTGALIQSACLMGCIAANAPAAALEAAEAYGLHLGLAFQIVDDVLEYEDETATSDEENEKATYISAFGYAEAKRLAAAHTEQAIAALSFFGERGETLRQFSLKLLKREK